MDISHLDQSALASSNPPPPVGMLPGPSSSSSSASNEVGVNLGVPLSNMAKSSRQMPKPSFLNRIARHCVGRVISHEIVQTIAGNVAAIGLGTELFGDYGTIIGSAGAGIWCASAVIKAAGRGPALQQVMRGFAESVGYGIAGLPILTVTVVVGCFCDPGVSGEHVNNGYFSFEE